MERIEYDTYLMEKFRESRPDPKQKEKADAMIRQMQTSLEKLAADIQVVDSSYTSTKARDYLGFSEDDAGVAERFGLALSFLGTVLILSAAFVCVFLYKLLSQKKENEA